ncbi:unnamed protein product [Calypogeia fissa]
MQEPPAFQTAAQCVACRSSFTTFKRRHHCRACGRSFCNDHSSNQMALPQYGLYTPVRVCDDCSNPPKLSAPNVRVVHAPALESNTSKFEGLDLGADNGISSKEEDPEQLPSAVAFDCTCGMPLCICEAPSVSEVVPPAQTIAPQKSREPRKVSTSNPSVFRQSTVASSGNSMPSLFFSSGTKSSGISHPPSKSYEQSGEGVREAVKNGDLSAVKELLSQGVDVNYVDKQGMSLLHLAAMFNFTEMTFLLMDSGANLLAKNAQGETPLDCAQRTLQHKMRLRIDSTVKK